jgi:tRNA(Ile)-lysidine synthase
LSKQIHSQAEKGRSEEVNIYLCIIRIIDMLARVHSFITRHNLAGTGNRILLAVSGGIDSMVMSSLFLHLPFERGIAHCNFSLRGEESDLDEELVRKFSFGNSIPFFTKKFDTKKYALEHGISTQMAARELRYSWFEQIMEAHGFDAVAVAHNLNDNAETILINLARGTGPAGLAGMKPKSGKIIRPLLFASREQISSYAEEHRIEFREDRSNSEVIYTRNKIRHNLLPLLEEINPSIIDTLTETAARFSELNEILRDFISGLKNDLMSRDDVNYLFDLAKLRSYSDNRTILFELFREFSLNSAMLIDLQHIIEGSPGSYIYTGTHRIIRDRDKLIVTSPGEADQYTATIRDVDELDRIDGISAEVRYVDDGFHIPHDNTIAALDLDRIEFPLILRRWQPGDFFYPLGMKDRKKLSDYFIDRKYSVPEKEKKLIVESAGKIICIIGDRIDDRYKITPETKKVLII